MSHYAPKTATAMLAEHGAHTVKMLAPHSPEYAQLLSDAFREALKHHRARLGYTAERMAGVLSVSLRTYHNWERGEAEAHVLAQEGAIARLTALPDPVPAKA